MTMTQPTLVKSLVLVIVAVLVVDAGHPEAMMRSAYYMKAEAQTQLHVFSWARSEIETLAMCLQTPNCPGVQTNNNGETKKYIKDYQSMYLTQGDTKLTFLRRQDGSVDFYRDWNSYRLGFGHRDTEFWLGLDTLHTLTSSSSWGLRVEMEAWNADHFSAEYSHFSVGPESDNYRLSVSGYDSVASTAGDSLTLSAGGRSFSTWDNDHDSTDTGNCAIQGHGAWWYHQCHRSQPTGRYFTGGTVTAGGVVWHAAYSNYYSFKVMEMSLEKQ